MPKSKAEYSKLVIRELRFFCQQRKITGFSNKNKNELIAMLIEYDNNSFHRSMSEELNVDINAAQLTDVVTDVIENDDDDDAADDEFNNNALYLNKNFNDNYENNCENNDS